MQTWLYVIILIAIICQIQGDTNLKLLHKVRISSDDARQSADFQLRNEKELVIDGFYFVNFNPKYFIHTKYKADKDGYRARYKYGPKTKPQEYSGEIPTSLNGCALRGLCSLNPTT